MGYLNEDDKLILIKESEERIEEMRGYLADVESGRIKVYLNGVSQQELQISLWKQQIRERERLIEWLRNGKLPPA